MSMLVVGCRPAPPVASAEDGKPLLALEPASQCNAADQFTPPLFTNADLSTILTKVLAFSTSPQTLSTLYSGSWTNWYALDMGTGLAKLATMRSLLDKFNLHDTYMPGTRPQVDCTGKAAVRQADGTCNDLVQTTAGAAGARIGRNIAVFQPGTTTPNPYAQGPASDAELLNPNPREVSRYLFTRDANGMKPVPFLNLFAAAWIQFMVHDWFSHGDNHPTDFYTVPLAADDPLRALNLTQLIVPKSSRDVTALGQPLPPVYRNEVTHWWDASQLYGSSTAQVNALRARDAAGNLKAELAVDDKGLLPVAADGFEQTGMRRNWWIGLGLMHNTFAKEHNAIVKMLRASHPQFNEQALFDHARLITAAVLAKIHTVEWTPAILPNRTGTVALHANWYGLKKFLDPISLLTLPTFMVGMETTIRATALTDPALADERVATARAAIYGVLGGETNNYGVPYSMTEEFVAVYRMHGLLPDAITIHSASNNATLGVYKTELTRNADARALEEKHGMTDVAFSFGVEHPGALVLNNYPKFIQELQIPSVGLMDMGTVDLLRDRERGIPRYNDFREQVQLKRVPSIEELTPDPTLRAALHKVYGNDVGAIDRLDMLVGTMAEATRPSCYGFGETLFQIFTVMATRRLQADRFYTKDFTAATYTAEGINWIANASMKSVLLRHYTALKYTGLASSQNAFYPWQ